MPCRGRPELSAKAVECFLAQTWRNKELVILDDSEKPAFPNGPPAGDGIRYWSESGHATIGAKRNVCIGRARGEMISHWDSDDHSDPGRMADQVARLELWGAEATGYHSMLFIDEKRKRAWRYHGRPDTALGTSLCYLKSFWKRHPFQATTNVGEDAWLVRKTNGKIVAVDAGHMMFAREHGDNTAPRKMMDRRRWEPLAWPESAA